MDTIKTVFIICLVSFGLRLTTYVQRLDREAKVWHLLEHPNVLPFMGISNEFSRFPALISPFCHNRDMVTYLERCSADRKYIVGENMYQS